MYCFPAVRQALPNRKVLLGRKPGNAATSVGRVYTRQKRKTNLCPSLPLGICSQITGLNFSCREKKAKRAEMEDQGPPESR